jgi:radical SAM superfamily enzyme YgiQ (UPF0313 family)
MNFTPPLSLLTLAAATPPDIEVRLVDERLEEINFNEKLDLIGISVVTRVAPRAYHIADEYRQRGVKAVLGGVHPSVLPQEASLHADAVVIGEGERPWPQIITDYRQRCLKPIYHGGHGADLSELPRPRRDVIPCPEKYATPKVVTASRGCPNSCTFCSAGVAVGKRYRTRNVREVVDELCSVPGRLAFFADDNLGWDIAYTKALLRALVPLNIMWLGELSLSALEDTELVELIAKSGCLALGVGFESLSPKVITAIKKNQSNNPGRYRELIRRLHSYGIPIVGHFIIGFDDDDRSVFEELVEFINETCIEMPSIATLIPYPGTTIFRQFEREGRLLHKDWAYYDTAAGYVVYQPKRLTPQELAEGYLMVTERVHAVTGVLGRLTGAKTLFSKSALPVIHYNLQSRSSIRQDIQKMKRAPTKTGASSQ